MIISPEPSWIVKDDNKNLHQKAQPLEFPINADDQKLIDRMVSYIDACFERKAKQYNIRSGVALAGPQVGLNKKVIYIHATFNKVEYKYLIANPTIAAESMQYCFLGSGEGCLSVDKDKMGVVKRRHHIIVRAFDIINHKDIVIDAEGLLSICLQHEMDHLDGILYYDRINQEKPNYYESKWIKY